MFNYYAISPAVTHGFNSERHGYRVAKSPKSSLNPSPHRSHSLIKVLVAAPTVHSSRRPTVASFAPSESPFQHIPREKINSLGSSHENSYTEHHRHHHPHKHYHAKEQHGKSAAGPSFPPSPLPYGHQFMPPAFEIYLSPSPSPYSSTTSQKSPTPAPSSRTWRISRC